MQTFESSHGPLRGVIVSQFPSVPPGSQEISLHGSPLKQSGVGPEQVPDWQVSVIVHASPSSQDPLSFAGVSVSQLPSVPPESQEAVLHWSPEDEQSGAEPPPHDPA